jgi:hypothetical protein
MSFRDLPTDRRRSASTFRRHAPRVVVESEAVTPSPARHDRYNQPLILHSHGRPVPHGEDMDDIAPSPEISPQHSKHFSRQEQLSHQLDEYQQVLTELEMCRAQSATPETTWRDKILVRTLQETDQDLWQNLRRHYRDTLKNGDETSQTACRQLQGEWSLLHESLADMLNQDRPQSTTYIRNPDCDRMSPAALTVSSRQEAHNIKDNDDYFDRVTRQADFEKMQTKMHLVQDIYNDLAGLVDQQQGRIDKLNEHISEAQVYAEAAVEEVGCYSVKEEFKRDPCGAMSSRNRGITFDDDGEDDFQEDMYDFWIHQAELCRSPVAQCRPKESSHEVDVMYEDDDDAIEILHVEPLPRESHVPLVVETLLNGFFKVHDDIVDATTNLLKEGKLMQCGAHTL